MKNLGLAKRHGSILVIGDDNPSHPEDFERKLQAFDKDLIIVWHRPDHLKKRRRPGMWKIEQCTRHLSGLHHADGRPKHSHVCARVYVTMVQDEQGSPIPLGEHVINKLREMRANSEAYGGQTERGLRNFIYTSNEIDRLMEAKREAARQDIISHNQRFNRRHFNDFYNLVERHDMRPNK